MGREGVDRRGKRRRGRRGARSPGEQDHPLPPYHLTPQPHLLDHHGRHHPPPPSRAAILYSTPETEPRLLGFMFLAQTSPPPRVCACTATAMSFAPPATSPHHPVLPFCMARPKHAIPSPRARLRCELPNPSPHPLEPPSWHPHLLVYHCGRSPQL